ncbi:hypothetical protein [Nonomuraea zeae]|uniref:Uncharacterized protein n=1 Tax=Nonomuraea zeae TaxID=1642303 RepID=A0A5S4GNE9_9ACTN|nr:hypothetical protein [Nonomuraea zeae]TMR34488.1 hypothetical protein ETD85_16825 [Nonomuraea zeae]
MIGAGVGVLAVPLIGTGLAVGDIERFYPAPQVSVDWIAMAAYAGALMLIGVLAGSRVSPVASLLPGLVFAGLGGAVGVSMVMYNDPRLWRELVPPDYLLYYEPFLYRWTLVIGLVLLVASVFPSRWRARPARSAPPPPAEEEVAEEAAADPAPPPLPKRIPSRY